MIYQKICLEIPYQSSSLVIVQNSENFYLTRCNGIAASKVDPFYQSLSCNQTPEKHIYRKHVPLEFSVSDSLVTFKDETDLFNSLLFANGTTKLRMM